MRTARATILLVIVASACTACSSFGSSGKPGQRKQVASLNEDEKHRLYTAALAASESPLDSDLFKDVCKKIGIFGADGKPNDSYMAFISAHVAWGIKLETTEFKQQIDTKEKARDYVNKHLPQ